VLFNPYTGEPRDVRDVQSDPQGILIVPPGRVEMLAAPPAQTPVEPEQSEPACYQYQDRDGQWCNFVSEKHYEDTKLDGNWPIRALYAAPPRREPLTYSEQLKHWRDFTETDVDWDEYRALYKHFAEIHGIT
jgi:hypothetical protein